MITTRTSRPLCRIPLVVAGIAVAVTALLQAVQQLPLTNDDILALLKAGLPAAVVVAKIQGSDQLSAPAIALNSRRSEQQDGSEWWVLSILV
jgi:hypothetical protein